MTDSEQKDKHWTRTYVSVFIIGILFIILFALFTSTFNLP